jgi:hypothetical protein
VLPINPQALIPEEATCLVPGQCLERVSKISPECDPEAGEMLSPASIFLFNNFQTEIV